MSTTLHQLSGQAGGGQLLRSALSLSMVTGAPFRMVNIRGQRPKPGLMRQHLTCVKAAAAVCGAEVEGAELGSTELVFKPGPICGGDFTFVIGSGGSTTLVFQTVLPALLMADKPSTLSIQGGTHNPMAPPFEFIAQCFLPVLERMGVQARVNLARPGFMEAGGGLLTAKIAPIKKWKKLKLTERGEARGTFGTVLLAHLPLKIAEREVATAAATLGWNEKHFTVRQISESEGPGNAILLGAQFANVCEISSGIGQMGKSSEAVAISAAKGLKTYLASSAPVGVHLADQLLLPMALAGGGRFHTMAISRHTKTNMHLIEQFLPMKFTLEEVGPGVHAVLG